MAESVRLTDADQQVYAALLREPSADASALASATGLSPEEVDSALQVLEQRQLLRPREEPGDESGTLEVVPPSVGFGQLVAEAEHRLAAQQADLGRARARLTSLAEQHHASLERESIIRLRSIDAVRDRLAVLAEDCRSECLSFNPDPPSPEAIEASKPLNEATLERGVSIRFVYADSVRLDVASRDYGQWLTDRGGQARTVPVVPFKMVIVDREVALLSSVPANEEKPQEEALEVRSPGLVGALISHFDTMWVRGQHLGHETDLDGDNLTAQQRELLHLLANGDTDASAARKLGVSLRTVRRMMAEMTELLGARSRLEVGVLAERRGWLDK